MAHASDFMPDEFREHMKRLKASVLNLFGLRGEKAPHGADFDLNIVWQVCNAVGVIVGEEDYSTTLVDTAKKTCSSIGRLLARHPLSVQMVGTARPPVPGPAVQRRRTVHGGRCSNRGGDGNCSGVVPRRLRGSELPGGRQLFSPFSWCAVGSPLPGGTSGLPRGGSHTGPPPAAWWDLCVPDAAPARSTAHGKVCAGECGRGGRGAGRAEWGAATGAEDRYDSCTIAEGSNGAFNGVSPDHWEPKGTAGEGTSDRRGSGAAASAPPTAAPRHGSPTVVTPIWLARPRSLSGWDYCAPLAGAAVTVVVNGAAGPRTVPWGPDQVPGGTGGLCGWVGCPPSSAPPPPLRSPLDRRGPLAVAGPALPRHDPHPGIAGLCPPSPD